MSITVRGIFIFIYVDCEIFFIFNLGFPTVATGHGLVAQLCACGVLVVCSLEVVTLYVGHGFLMTANLAALGVDPVATVVAFFVALIINQAVDMISGGDALLLQCFIAVYASLGLKTFDRTGCTLFYLPFSSLTAMALTGTKKNKA